MGILRRNKNVLIKIKSTGTEIKNAFDEPSNRLGMAKEKKSLSSRISQQKLPKLRREKSLKKNRTGHPRTWNYYKNITYEMELPEGGKEKLKEQKKHLRQ